MVIDSSTGSTTTTLTPGLGYDVQGLFFDSNADLFVATGEGVYKLTSSSSYVTKETVVSGLVGPTGNTKTANALYSIAVDSTGAVFVSTVGYFRDGTAGTPSPFKSNVASKVNKYTYTGSSWSAPTTLKTFSDPSTGYRTGTSGGMSIDYDDNYGYDIFFTTPVMAEPLANDLLVMSYDKDGNVARLPNSGTGTAVTLDTRVAYKRALRSKLGNIYTVVGYGDPPVATCMA